MYMVSCTWGKASQEWQWRVKKGIGGRAYRGAAIAAAWKWRVGWPDPQPQSTKMRKFSSLSKCKVLQLLA